MQVFVAAILVVCVASGHGLEYEKVPDYAWKVYYGTVPRSALSANDDYCANPIYIGLSWFKDGFLPGTLKAGNSTLVATANGNLFVTDRNVLILTTHHSQFFVWKNITTDNFESFRNETELVVGGVETNYDVYIGRQYLNDELLVGKIYRYDTGYELVLADVKAGGEKDIGSLKYWYTALVICVHLILMQGLSDNNVFSKESIITMPKVYVVTQLD